MGCKTGGQCFPEKVLEHVWLGVSADSSHITSYSKPGPLQCCCSPIVGGSGVWALSHWISGFGVPPGLCPRCPLGLLSHLRAPSPSLAGFSSSRAFEQREGLGPSLEVGWRPHSVRATWSSPTWRVPQGPLLMQTSKPRSQSVCGAEREPQSFRQISPVTSHLFYHILVPRGRSPGPAHTEGAWTPVRGEGGG